MKVFYKISLFLLCFFLNEKKTNAQLKTISLEYPQIKNGNIVENNLLIHSDTNDTFSFLIKIFKSDNLLDSVLLKEINLKNINIKKGYNSINISNEWSDLKSERLDYFEILRYTNNLLPGKYIIFVANPQRSINSYNYWQVDSLLSNESALFKNLEADYNNQMDKLKSSANLLGKLTSKKINIADLSSIKLNKVNDKLLEKADRDIQLNFPQIRVEKQLDGTTGIFNFYYKNNFIGTYHWDLKKAPQKIYEEQKEKLMSKSQNLLEAESEKYKTLLSKFQESSKKLFSNNEMKSTINVDSYLSNEQEEHSPNENFYTELSALTKAKIFGIPFVVDAYYTTQDKNRTVKSSYFRFEYDMQSAKNSLEENIALFKTDYESKKLELFKVENIYQGYIKKMEGEKSQLLKGLTTDFDISKYSNSNWNEVFKNPTLLNSTDTNQLFQTLIDKAQNELEKDSTCNLKKEQIESKQKLIKEKKELAKQKYEQAQKAVKKILEIEEKVRKYYALINQTKNSLKLDSGMVLEKIKSFDKNDDLSYSSLLKKSKDILPKNDFTKYTKGLNKLNFGILNNYESEYTMSSQSMKGLNVEYAINKINVGVMAGKTEYVSRDLNSLDVYNSILAKVSSKINESQEIKFVYFSYSPSAKMLNNNFYANIKNNASQLNNSTGIISMIYEGNLAKNFDIKADIASNSFSKNKDEEKEVVDLKKIAYKTSLEYVPSKFPVGASIQYENVGANFINETLPFIRKDFSALNLALNGEFFKGYIKTKITYQELLRTPNDNTFKNQKWGVELKTTSKRYPNLLLSYKPFTTFSSINDTFNIAQRPLFGEVINSKLSYQKKGKKYSHQWFVIFNRNRTNVDSLDYNTEVIQMTYNLKFKKGMGGFQVGRMKMPELFSTSNNQQNYFIRMNEQFMLVPRLNVQLSEEIAWYKKDINRFGMNMGFAYSLKQKPLSFRAQFRYMYYVNSAMEKKNLFGANVGFTYNLELKKD